MLAYILTRFLCHSAAPGIASSIPPPRPKRKTVAPPCPPHPKKEPQSSDSGGSELQLGFSHDHFKSPRCVGGCPPRAAALARALAEAGEHRRLPSHDHHYLAELQRQQHWQQLSGGDIHELCFSETDNTLVVAAAEVAVIASAAAAAAAAAAVIASAGPRVQAHLQVCVRTE